MKILLSVGHSLLINGCYTSADGRAFGGVLEYRYNKSIVKPTAEYLRKAGHTVDVLICPERVFKKSTDEKAYKLPRANKGRYDLVCELHLNASKLHNARGCEVLYISEEGKKIAQRVLASLAKVFKNRGVQKRSGLYMLNSTKPTAIMLETFFCDNSEDCSIAAKTDVALLIAEGIHGAEIIESEAPITDRNENREDNGLFRFRVIGTELNIREDPGTEYKIVGVIRDKNVYTIVETKKAKDGGMWGRLKSGAGWVNISEKYINKV